MNILFISLGCDKNLCDSEYMLSKLDKAGHVIVDNEDEADIVVINTCAFICDAKEESINNILEMAEYKKQGRIKHIIVAGCLSERYKDDILKEIPEIDAIIGTTAVDKISEAIENVIDLSVNKEYFMSLNTKAEYEETGRFVTTGGHFAYLKIAEGCDKHCTYCIIPSLRGSYRSVPMERLLSDAKELVKNGVSEIILVAQETTVYGVDLYGKKSLPILLDELNKIPDLKWIRLLYAYPEEIDLELIRAIKRNEKVLHYIDMPIQHINDTVLKLMGRRTTGSDIADIIELLRKHIPDICIRTSLITGFPGETEEMHKELLSFINWAEFDRLGCFTYSPEEGTAAVNLPDQINEEIKKQRQSEVMELQQEISLDLNEKLVGSIMTAFVEGYIPDEDVYIARTYRDAPGVDGQLFINSDKALNSGDFVKIKITSAAEYDLIGELYESA